MLSVNELLLASGQALVVGAMGLGRPWLSQKIQAVHVIVNSANTALQNELKTANANLATMAATLATERSTAAAATGKIIQTVKEDGINGHKDAEGTA